MDREQHVIQDAAEHYAVYVMQREAEGLGVAAKATSMAAYDAFLRYLTIGGIPLAEFKEGKYSRYRRNADFQLPAFVRRLSDFIPEESLDFENVEAEYRNLGLKGDFLIHCGRRRDPLAVSLKNYIGTSGIMRPQVASGTFASFAASFVFARAGVGRYEDPRAQGAFFLGRQVAARNEVLEYMGHGRLIRPLSVLDDLQSKVREEFLGDDCRFYDRARVQAAARRVAQVGVDAVLEVFEILGHSTVRHKMLERIGMDGKEEALFFDSQRYVDSITNKRYHDFREGLNSPGSTFDVKQRGQGIRFSFSGGDFPSLHIDVPFTINTNGAWYRPSQRFEGVQTYNDKGHTVELSWGERRPYKSREIATSVNTYVDLSRTGIFGG